MPVINVPPSPTSVIPRGTPNAAFNASQTHAPAGANNFGIIGAKSKSPAKREKEIVNNLRNRFDDYFFNNHLKIDTPHIMNFLTYIFENGFQEKFLKKEHALELVVFLENKSESYRKLIAE